MLTCQRDISLPWSAVFFCLCLVLCTCNVWRSEVGTFSWETPNVDEALLNLPIYCPSVHQPGWYINPGWTTTPFQIIVSTVVVVMLPRYPCSYSSDLISYPASLCVSWSPPIYRSACLSICLSATSKPLLLPAMLSSHSLCQSAQLSRFPFHNASLQMTKHHHSPKVFIWPNLYSIDKEHVHLPLTH